MRLRNNTEERSKGPPGVITEGITGGFPFFASITPNLKHCNTETNSAKYIEIRKVELSSINQFTTVKSMVSMYYHKKECKTLYISSVDITTKNSIQIRETDKIEY